MEANLLNKLSNDCLKLLDDKEDYNVIINVNNAQRTKTFYAHSAILRQRSSYFHEHLVKTKKNKNNIKSITLTNVTVQHFEIIIRIDFKRLYSYINSQRYIYGGVISLENIDSSFIVELMLASCEFFLEEFIRYFHISNHDIVENVQSYHQILEKNLWKDLLRKLISSNHPITSKILPPRTVLAQQLPLRADELGSNIINDEHAAEIASWVDKRDYSTKNNPYRFNLLLRGSRDGFTSASFWNLCNEQVNVIVIMKVKGTDEILGGYNPIAWHKPFSKRFTKESDDCFIFSLKNGTIKNSILSRVKKPETAVLCHSKYGPCFGGGGLTLKDNCDQGGQCQCFNYNNDTYNPIRDKSTYDEVDGCSKFSVKEYEVLKIYNPLLEN